MTRMSVCAILLGVISFLCIGCFWVEPLNHQDLKHLEQLTRQTLEERQADGSLTPRLPQVQTPLMSARVPLLPAKDEHMAVWPLSLQKCVEIALANNPTLQIVRLDPAIEETRVQNALAAFDAVLRASAGWGRNEEISTSAVTTGDLESIFDTADDDSSGLEAVTSTSAAYQVELEKPLVTGGSFKVSTGFERVKTTNLLVSPNPYYSSDATFTFTHPLLRGAGIELNRSSIRVARLEKGVAAQSFRAEVLSLLQQIEQAYWQLWFAHADLKSRRAALVQSKETLKKVETKLEAGSASVPEREQARQQYQQFRGEVLEALDRMHDSDLALRRRMGVTLDDQRIIMPTDEPSEQEVKPVWSVALKQAMHNRPELVQQQLAMRASQIAIDVARNALLPQLDFQALWRVNGLGADHETSLEVVTENDFNDWELALSFEFPIGNRDAEATLKRSKLEYLQAKRRLFDLEQQVKEDVLSTFRSMTSAFKFIPIRREQLKSSEERFRASKAFYDEGRITTDLLLEAEAELAQAQRVLDAAIASYNIALVNFELAKGTLLKYNNVTVNAADDIR